jgi:hypothetical protein
MTSDAQGMILDAHDAAELERQLVSAAAVIALQSARVRPHVVTLFRPHIEKHLRADLASGDITVVDEIGRPRHGITSAILAAEVRDRFDTPRGRYFEE